KIDMYRGNLIIDNCRIPLICEEKILVSVMPHLNLNLNLNQVLHNILLPSRNAIFTILYSYIVLFFYWDKAVLTKHNIKICKSISVSIHNFLISRGQFA